MNLERVIVHWVPPKVTGDTLRLSNSAWLDFDREFWIARIGDSMSKQYTREIEDIPATPSNAVAKIRLLIACSSDDFVLYSQDLAFVLYAAQSHHLVSAGFLIVFRGEEGQERFICIMKLEGVRGSEARFDDRKESFEIRPLEKILLTEKTRVFKMAHFRFSGPHLMKSLAMDDQLNRDEISHFWLTSFLGCRYLEAPEVLTRNFFTAVSQFSKSQRLTLDEAIKVRTALFSELNSNAKTISVSHFADNYVPPTAIVEFNKFIEKSGVPLRDFEKKLDPVVRKALAVRKFLLEENILAYVPQNVLDAGRFAEIRKGQRGQAVLKIEAPIVKEK